MCDLWVVQGLKLLMFHLACRGRFEDVSGLANRISKAEVVDRLLISSSCPVVLLTPSPSLNLLSTMSLSSDSYFIFPLFLPSLLSPLPTTHSPLHTPHSPLPTPHSPLPTPHSPLPTLHSES